MDDGRELLALYVLADKQNWVAWTPEGSREVRGPTPYLAIENEPPPKLIVDPPLPRH
jgi:hypothetical protein